MPSGEKIRLNWRAMIESALQAYVGDPSGYTSPPYVRRIAGIRTARLA